MSLIRLLFISILLLPAPALATTDQPLVIFAAASLRQPFEALADLYQQRYQQPRPTLHFAGSQILRTQLQQGAAADIFASANQQVIAILENEQLIGSPQLFAANRLVLVVDKQQQRLKKLADLALPGVLLVVGNQHVPVGRYTRQLWSNLAGDPDYGAELMTNIQRNIISEETSVKAIVTKLQLGEVDAGIVYRSELSAALLAQTVVIELPQQHNPIARYPIAMTRQSKQPDNALSFINLVLTDEGQQLLGNSRFLPVPRRLLADE